MPRIYAAYKGDDVLCIGTVKEIAKALGVKEKTVRWWGTPSNTEKRFKENSQRRILIEIDDESEEDEI